MKSYRCSSIHFVNNLRSIRLEKELTQVQLAHLVGTSQNTISAIESGTWKPSLYLALLISYALDVKITDLFDLDIIS